MCTNFLPHLVLTNITRTRTRYVVSTSVTQTDTCITTTLSSRHIVFSPPCAELKFSVSTKPDILQLQVSVYIISHTLRQARRSTPLIAKVGRRSGYHLLRLEFGGTVVAYKEEAGSWCNNSCAPSLLTAVWTFKFTFLTKVWPTLSVGIVLEQYTIDKIETTNNANFRVFHDVQEVTEHDSSPGKVDVWNLPTGTAGRNAPNFLNRGG
ncbi:uncharacterized protein F5147DRAFT_655166 [Suillus discolor]|uniref:Uncharacterized protein n=1 Tax=Suillus discolor TaxID=1912936 RepID=A0A9P7JRF3_9AGAM|nr:uncharacterized protein F5147DRAFT_655166 [Suillus discolor]KAG2101842.1 hypothetical protein F5147DRAFT_655166 [Suillus discolor]